MSSFYSCLFSLVCIFSFFHSEDETVVFLKDKIKSSPNNSLFYSSFLNLYNSDNSTSDKKFYSNIIKNSILFNPKNSDFDTFSFYLNDVNDRLKLDPIKFNLKLLLTKDDVPWCFIYPSENPFHIFQDIESKLKVFDDGAYMKRLRGVDASTWVTTVFKLEKYENGACTKVNIKGVDYCFPNSKSLFFKFGSSELRYSNNTFTDHGFDTYTDWYKNKQRFDFLNLATDKYIQNLINNSTDFNLRSFYTNFLTLYKSGKNKNLHDNIIKNIDDIIFLQNTNVTLGSLGIVGLNPGSSFNYRVALILTKQKNIWVFAYPVDNTPVEIFQTIQNRLVNVEKNDFKNSMKLQDANSWSICLFKLKKDAGGGIKNGINMVSFKKLKDPVLIPDITSKLILDNFGVTGFDSSENKLADLHFQIYIDWSEHLKNNHGPLVNFLINNFPNNKTSLFIKTPEGKQQLVLDDLIGKKKLITYLEPHRNSSFKNIQSIFKEFTPNSKSNDQIVFITRNPITTLGEMKFRNDDEYQEFKKNIYEFNISVIQMEGPAVESFYKIFDFDEYQKPSVGYHQLDYDNTNKLKFPIFGN